MTNKTASEIAAEILVALIDKAQSTGNVKEDAERAAAAYKVIFQTVQNPR